MLHATVARRPNAPPGPPWPARRSRFGALLARASSSILHVAVDFVRHVVIDSDMVHLAMGIVMRVPLRRGRGQYIPPSSVMKKRLGS